MSLIDAVKDTPILNAIKRGAARAGCVCNNADAAEIMYALLDMKIDDKLRLASRLTAKIELATTEGDDGKDDERSA
jgi:hypothetical protein